MVIFKIETDLKKYIESKKKEGLSVGFIPTMGALHEGHISLIKTAKEKCDICISSIFVNPTQFNDVSDYKKYPKTLEDDILKLQMAHTDILFLPENDEIYPNGDLATQTYDLGGLETILEGKYRPGHFQGVCQVVHRLLDIVTPDFLFLGQKDLQQCFVIKKMAALIGSDTEIIICPTLREADGLAMSSRNTRLTEAQRKGAATIFNVLSFVKENFKDHSLDILKSKALEVLENEGFKVDYFEVVEAISFNLVSELEPDNTYSCLTAAFIGDVRLIDNLIFEV